MLNGRNFCHPAGTRCFLLFCLEGIEGIIIVAHVHGQAQLLTSYTKHSSSHVGALGFACKFCQSLLNIECGGLGMRLSLRTFMFMGTEIA